jgi:hypothetical protein
MQYFNGSQEIQELIEMKRLIILRNILQSIIAIPILAKHHLRILKESPKNSSLCEWQETWQKMQKGQHYLQNFAHMAK